MAEQYVVTSQTPSMRLAPNGSFEDVMEVHFDVPSINGSNKVTLPLSQYTPENVHAQIQYLVDQMIGVHNL